MTVVLRVAEPPARLRARPPLVVDCSALAAIVFQEPGFKEAAYLWLAEQLRCPLVTFDERLGRAATRHLAGLGDSPD